MLFELMKSAFFSLIILINTHIDFLKRLPDVFEIVLNSIL